MTHVYWSWRNLLLSTPTLWTRIDSSAYKSKQVESFLGRSEGQLLDIFKFFERGEHMEPFLSITLRNTRLQRLKIVSFLRHLDHVLVRSTRPALELKHLDIGNEHDITEKDMRLPGTIFDGQLPKLTSLTLCHLHMDLRGSNLPSLTRFSFRTGTKISFGNLTQFF